MAFVGACGAIGGDAADLLPGWDLARQLGQYRTSPTSLAANPATRVSGDFTPMPVWILRQPGRRTPLARRPSRGGSCRHGDGHLIRPRPSILMPALATSRCKNSSPVGDDVNLSRILGQLGALKSDTPRSRPDRLSGFFLRRDRVFGADCNRTRKHRGWLSGDSSAITRRNPVPRPARISMRVCAMPCAISWTRLPRPASFACPMTRSARRSRPCARLLSFAGPDEGEAEEVALQNLCYAIGKEFAFDPLRDWFKALYEVLLGASDGPRFGGFIALYGIEGTIVLIDRALAGELIRQAGLRRLTGRAASSVLYQRLCLLS